MNIIEKLLKLDAGKIELPQKEVEIKRLSKLSGEKVIFKLQGVHPDKQDSIREMAIKGDKIDVAEVRLENILEGVKEPNLRDAALMKHFGAATPYDLVNKLLLPGEQDALYENIQELSGYGDDAVQEVKN
jgi:hypothetical protein